MSDHNYSGEEASRLARKRVDEAEAKAKAKAAEDALITKDPVAVELKPGYQPTLAELNEMSERTARANSDIAHEAAVKAAHAVKNTLKSQGAGVEQHNRIKKAAAKQRQANAADGGKEGPTPAESKKAELQSTDTIHKGE